MNPKEKDPDATGRPAIDWSEVHRRIDAAQSALERRADQDERKQILASRARALAQEPEQQAAAESLIEIVEFTLAYEKYGLESGYVREVYPLKDLTVLPGTPRHVLGIVNVRGQILSVIDLKRFFDLPQKGLTDLNKLIVLESGPMAFCVLADVIGGVRSLPVRNLVSSLPTITGLRADFLQGVSPDGAIILDAAKLLSSSVIIVSQDVDS